MSWLANKLLGATNSGVPALPPTVKLSFDDVGSPFLDTGTLGLTWTSSLGDPARTEADPKFGEGCLLRNSQTSNAGLRTSHQVFDYSNDFTCAFWFKDVLCGGVRTVLGGTIGTQQEGLKIGLSATGQFSVSINIANNPFASVSSSKTYEESVGWYHFAVTHLVASKTLLLHLDGVYIGESATPYSADPAGATLVDLLGDCTTVQIPPFIYLDDFTVLPYAKYGRADYIPPTSPL